VSSKTLRLILGDQLNIQHSWFQEKPSDEVVYLMMELGSETNYTRHHIQKILGFFTAMRDFANELKKLGHQLIYIKLDDKNNKQNFGDNIKSLIKDHSIEKFEYQEPDEYRLDLCLKNLDLNIPAEIYSTEHFLGSRDQLEIFFGKKEKYLMENFYRKMRVKHSVLMDNSKPLGGKWNYDSENRKKFPNVLNVPKPLGFNNNIASLLKMLETIGVDSIGEAPESQLLDYPVNRKQALELMQYFLDNLLDKFGTYQDAMSEKEYFGYHSRLSFALNIKLINPLELIRATEEKFRQCKDSIELSQAEGFIRQILGWREFMRSYYWIKMPKFSKTNFFENYRQLPQFYWNADTKMNCLHHCIKGSLKNAYAHHIQRLMVTGNFALLAEVHPDEVDAWFLGIYIDAIEWVEITNTRGMSQWADGGGLATKPYISSANYINKMSDYCKNCFYDYKSRYSSKNNKPACPFNSLYWSFLNKHKDKLENNMRMSMVYKVWEKTSEEEKEAILTQAKEYQENIDRL
jgi:deoxyribodipyrimidine photolyase-related protein